jgi:DNA-directed RNA polymerase subunit RPC12/RpoP
MTISVQCGSCGKRFAAKEKLAGRKVKCPQCGGVLTIPKPRPAPEAALELPKPDDEYAVTLPPAGETGPSTAGRVSGTERAPGTKPKCPSCGASLKPGAVLCVECGYDMRTGKKQEVSGPEEPAGPAFPWLKVSLLGGACLGLVVICFIVYAMFLPPAAVRVGSSGISETPKEFAEVEFGERDYRCECPKGWEVTSGGGKDGVPPWTKLEKGGALIQIRDSLSGTPGAMLDRSLHFGTDIDRGVAPVDEVHEHRITGVASSMRNYKESAHQKLDHKLGDALIAEFTAKPMFGKPVRGYHATVLQDFHQFTIVCRCAESEWETLKPAFDHVISTLVPITDDDMPGIF